ncbi:hypothetical protein D1BOALGB6SA_4255 [Olavius sp. associated proteobacterium Delta 1]|nr:hypothetical protein D1BOALGB6SA_4255 [Olavius sp. associated proteobacterium Delta 1]
MTPINLLSDLRTLIPVACLKKQTVCPKKLILENNNIYLKL